MYSKLNWSEVSKNPNISLKFIEDNIDMPFNWGYRGLSCNPIVTKEFMSKHTDKDWFLYEKEYEEEKENLKKSDIELMQKILYNIKTYKINLPNCKIFSNCSYLIEEIVDLTINNKWHFGIFGLSLNPNITCNLVEKYPHKNWYYGANGLSSNPSINVDFIKKNLDKDWDFGCNGLSANPSITLDFYEETKDREWDFGQYGLSINPVITKEFIEIHKDKNWAYGKGGISSNPSLLNLL
jgi:hypothetical protein